MGKIGASKESQKTLEINIPEAEMRGPELCSVSSQQIQTAHTIYQHNLYDNM